MLQQPCRARYHRRALGAREFGATDIVEERGDQDAAKIKEMTGDERCATKVLLTV